MNARAIAAGLAAAVASVLFVCTAADGAPAKERTAPAPVKTTAPKVLPQPELDTTRTPILILVEQGVTAQWGVEEAAQAWNDAIGCEVFITTPDRDAHVIFRVEEVPDLKLGETEVGGYAALDAGVVRLNPDWLEVPGVAAHELGHLLGLGHYDVREGMMAGYANADRSHFSDREIGDAQAAQMDRCGVGN